MATRPMHLDGKSIADAIDAAVAAADTGRTAANVAHAADTGVVHPANVAYTQADQTALAAAVQDLTTKLNAVIDALVAADLMAAP